MVAFEKAGCWRQVFAVTLELNKSPAERMTTARRISSQSLAYDVLMLILEQYVVEDFYMQGVFVYSSV